MHSAHTGLACLAALAKRHRLDLTVPRLIHDYQLSEEVAPKRLASIASRAGLRARHQRTDWSSLVNFGKLFPVIARCGDGTYLIVAGATREENGQGGVAVIDPRQGADIQFLSPEAFREKWTGDVLLLSRNYRFFDEDQPFSLRWFASEVLRQGSQIRDIAIAALTLNVLALLTPIFFQIVIDKVLVHQAMTTLTVVGIGIVVAILFDGIFEFLRGFLLLFVGNRVDIRVAVRTFNYLLSLPGAFFQRMTAGVLVKHLQQSESIREFLTGSLMMTLLEASVLFVFIPVMLFYSWQLTLIVLSFSALMGAVIGFLIGPFRRRLLQLYRAEGERQSMLVETIHGMGTIKALALEPRQREAWETVAAAAIGKKYEVGKISTFARALSSFLEKSMSIAIVWIGALAVFDQRMTVGELVAFQMLSGRISRPLVRLVSLIHEYQQTALSVRMLGEVMNAEPERNNNTGLRTPIKGHVRLEDVNFRYPGAVRPALSQVNVDIAAGQYVGIVGRSGSGKTTLSRLIQGIHMPQSGLLRIDGTDVREIDLAYLRQNIGVVPQEAFLFRGTIRSNIMMSKPDASFEEVVEAGKMAGANEFIEQLPQGFETELDEGAANLSGGQKQRLAIARALLRRPPILIFDEATSALDPESEAIVVESLEGIARHQTTIVITHRLATIRNADVIFVLEDGEISDAAPHDDLFRNCEIYRRLWLQQTGQVKEAAS